MANKFQHHHSKYAAFCRKRGAHDDKNWNDELLDSILSVLEAPWLGLEAWVLTQRLHLGRDVGATFEKNTNLLSGIIYNNASH